jgi:hypothetical protein
MRISRRTAGRLLIAYAMVAFALVILGGLIGLDLAGRVERLSGTASATLSAAARATEAAADAFADVDGSLAEARASSDAAATLARDASGTLRSLALAMDVSILGTRPLQGLGGQFDDTAGQAAELADTLDAVGASLGDTRTNVARIGPELAGLGAELTALGDEPDAASAAAPLRLFVILLLVWLLMQAAGSLVAGLALLRGPAET